MILVRRQAVQVVDQDQARAPLAALPDGLLRRTTYLLVRLSSLGKRRVVERLATEDLGASLPPHRLHHLAVLTSLAELGPVSQRQVGEHLGKDCSDLVAVLDDLEVAGLVVRGRDQRDRRRHRVMLTPAGRRALARLDEAAWEAEDAVLAPLDERERELLHGLLRRVLARHDPRVPRPEDDDHP
jgi:MarR family transcriptional regulator, lower aerobic nicotinate degradation pathway regulator